MAESEYISRRALLDAIPKPWAKDEKISQWGAVRDCIIIATSVPAADVAPVVHGEWIDKGEFYPPCHDYKCSVCKKSERMAEHKQFLFCPNCGAKMDGGKKE